MADKALDTLQQLHDDLLACQPDGAGHDRDSCAGCQKETQEVASVTTGSTYTEAQVAAEVQKAVTAAVGEVKAQLETLRASQEEHAVEVRIADAVAEAVAPVTEQVAVLQGQLDQAALATAAEKARADALEATVAEKARSEEIAARRDARLAAVKETRIPFTEEFMVAKADWWAGLEETVFASLLEGYTASAAATPADTSATTGLPLTTALTAAIGDLGGAAKPAAYGAHRAPVTSANLRALGEARRAGIDIRKI